MMTAAEVEFLAEKQLIDIVPNFNHSRIHLISGDVGPFTASLPVSVPLWLAVNLKQRQKCRIIAPEWMNVEKLEEKKEEEANSLVFTKLPSEHFVETTQVILSCATSDVPRADEIRTLTKDIWDLRLTKLRNSVETFIRSDSTHAQLNHLTVMEINMIRQFLVKALDQLNHLRQSTRITDGDSQDA